MSTDDYSAIAQLDLEPIKVKLMHKESGEGWSLEHANAVEFEYRRFLILMKKYPTEQTAPLFDVDIFWHYHILDTQKYAIDCAAIFGYFLHHFPYIGLRGEADEAAHVRVGQRMKQLYEATFGEDYLRGVSEPVGQLEWSGAAGKVARTGKPAQPQGAGTAAARSAYSGAAVRTAFSGTATQIAYSGAAAPATARLNADPLAGMAWVGMPLRAGQTNRDTGFYSDRPHLPATR
ncbi:MAG: glycine-rich domain-containing protein-like [Pseudomonadota bacterium]